MPKVVIIVNPVSFTNPRRTIAQNVALETMSRLPSQFKTIAISYKNEICPVKLPNGISHHSVLKRDSGIEIENSRPLPYIKEMIDFASSLDFDIIGYINSDILLGRQFIESINIEKDCYIFSRSDIGEIGATQLIQGLAKIIYGGDKHAGADGFFFNKKWWVKNRDLFPDDLIIGETEWDTCYRHIIKCNTENYIEKRCLYHVYHDAKWDTKSKGAQNNIRIWNEVKKIKSKFSKTIPLNFGLFWSGAKLSHLRYLTFKTLRHFHPDSNIDLYCSSYTGKNNMMWNNEAQDFQRNNDNEDYFERLHDLNINIVIKDSWSKYPPNYQSDFFRWWWIKNFGGFYLDCDQIILRKFDTLPLNTNIIYSKYPAKSCGIYAPVGVIGAIKESSTVSSMHDNVIKGYNERVYNSIGPDLFRKVSDSISEPNINLPPKYFYPIPESYMVEKIYNGEYMIENESYALHWFGGHPLSQKFNSKYTEDFAKKSQDTISKFIRSL